MRRSWSRPVTWTPSRRGWNVWAGTTDCGNVFGRRGCGEPHCSGGRSAPAGPRRSFAGRPKRKGRLSRVSRHPSSMPEPLRVLLTGGAGFIGSHLVDRLLERPEIDLTVLDKLTYAGNLDNVASHRDDDRFHFERGDVADAASVLRLVEGTDRVIHAAAESHVDRSIHDATDFVRSNVLGTHVVLEACRRTGHPLLQISTDEVYGSIAEGSFSEDVALRPNSPYAATKAAGDLLC